MDKINEDQQMGVTTNPCSNLAFISQTEPNFFRRSIKR